MEGMAQSCPLIDVVTDKMEGQAFTVVDVGCSGGIDAIWKTFGPRLRVIGFDPNLNDIKRLNAAETHKGVKYIDAFAVLPEGHSFGDKKQGQQDLNRNPWSRLSAPQTVEILNKQNPEMSEGEKTKINCWSEVQLTKRKLVVPDYLVKNSVTDLDFLKIDVDGKDYEILQSFDSALEGFKVLGVGIEVNFCGSANDTDHTFHNVDRFLKAQGFELLNVSVRRYSTAALPSRYILNMPAQTETGRILQGDALYVRDLASPEHHAFAQSLSPEKLVNLLCLYGLFNLPDSAAEVALKFRQQLSTVIDVEAALNALAAQTQHWTSEPLSYKDYMQKFAENDPMFWLRKYPK